MKTVLWAPANLLLLTGLWVTGCRSTMSPEPQTENIRVILKSEVEWTHLNPKRGDLAPSAGTLWGDRNGTEPTGFLLRPPRDFESPPHIHNVSYRGVVIEGVIHNDDPKVDELWMPEGSFWTQPKGDIHITSAQGSGALAYIEIEQGPYLVLPSEEAFDSGERPINVDESNVVWLDNSDITWLKHSDAQTAVLWRDREEGALYGCFIKLPAGFNGSLQSEGSTFRAVVIQGQLSHATRKGQVLDPGSGFRSEDPAVHHVMSHQESILYVRTDGEIKIHAK
ncbi:DUF4437 domain-containing protein [Kiritimatiellaeota bacterium B1221]|nr:DUF4437 domain-containing protein [Kiritimatiellaeota bacterium B1221]